MKIRTHYLRIFDLNNQLLKILHNSKKKKSKKRKKLQAILRTYSKATSPNILYISFFLVTVKIIEGKKKKKKK